jgi:hypothetical protein
VDIIYKSIVANDAGLEREDDQALYVTGQAGRPHQCRIYEAS